MQLLASENGLQPKLTGTELLSYIGSMTQKYDITCESIMNLDSSNIQVEEWKKIAYAIYLVINYFVGTIAGVKQSSMYPTSKEGDRVVISRRVLFNKSISRSDVVILEAPIDVEENETDFAVYEERTGLDYFTYNIMGLGKRSYIKRVIGLPGDHIFIAETGDVYINDKILEEPYLVEGLKTPRTGDYYDVIIPEGYYFVMGDNREGSRDSRELELIPEAKIEGKVVTRIWPLNKMGGL